MSVLVVFVCLCERVCISSDTLDFSDSTKIRFNSFS